MDIRHAVHHSQSETFGTEELRRHFLIERVFEPGRVTATYTHYDRMMILGIEPGGQAVGFTPDMAAAAGTRHLLERRELGAINIGRGPARVTADGAVLTVEPMQALYLGQGAAEVAFEDADPARPSRLYAVSAPAHARHPHRVVTADEAEPLKLGSVEAANKRTLFKFLHADLLPTCQIVMGLTRLEPGSVWNTMPAHTHDRRMEAYFYFDLPADGAVIHLMGRPEATRHLVVRNEQAVLSPPWSIHCGSGTASYAFIWAMAGDNQSFADMDVVAMEGLR